MRSNRISDVLHLLVCIGFVAASPLTTGEPERREEDNTCAGNIYCPGENFEHINQLGDKFVECDTALKPRDFCCLPQEKHLMCYNIKIDGQYLNFDQASPAKATDFQDLCKALVKSQGKEPGNYAKITLDTTKGGYIRYNYGEFKVLEYPSEHRIKDLACGLAGDYPGKYKTLPLTTTTTTTTSSPTTASESEPEPEVDVQN